MLGSGGRRPHGRSSGRPTDAMFTTTVCRDRIVAVRADGVAAPSVAVLDEKRHGAGKTYGRVRPTEPIPTCTGVVLAGSWLERARKLTAGGHLSHANVGGRAGGSIQHYSMRG